MYEQEVVISPDVLGVISNGCITLDIEVLGSLKAFKETLECKRILLDGGKLPSSIILTTMKNILFSPKREANNLVNDIYKLILSRRISPAVPSIKSFTNDPLLNIILSLALLGKDKIVNTEYKIDKHLLQISSEIGKIQFLSLQEFCDPPEWSWLISKRARKIEIPKSGTIFRFEKIFEPYFRGAKKLIVNDRHVRIRNQGFLNFRRILDLCNSTVQEVCISTTLDDDVRKYKSFKPDMNENELRNEICSATGLSPEKVRIQNGEHMRYIRTEDFRIRFEPNLWFVKDDYRTRGRVVIDIEHVSTLKD